MGLKPGYKQTEVGVVPEDWEVVLLDSVAKRGSGHTPSKAHPEYWGGEIKWVSLQDSDRLDRLYIYDTAAKITPAGLANSSATMHAAGTVVLSRDAGVGKSAIMKGNMAVSQHFMAWKCGPRLDNRFLYYWLQARKTEFERIAMGNTIKTIGLAYFKLFVCPLPTKVEQKAIAEALNNADFLIDSLEHFIAKKRNLKQGAMQGLFRPKDGWLAGQIGSVTERIVGGGTPSRAVGRYWSGDIPWMTVKDFAQHSPFGTLETITKQGLKNSAANLIPKHTLITSTRMALGKAVMFEVDVSINQDLKAIFPTKDTDTHFLYYWFQFNEPRIAELGSGSTVMGISLPELRKIPFSIPPLSQQTAIAAVLSDMDAEIAALETKLAKVRQIKQGMMHNLLTGRIRLV
jgi:type I restriction enzyme, S subunit